MIQFEQKMMGLAIDVVETYFKGYIENSYNPKEVRKEMHSLSYLMLVNGINYYNKKNPNVNFTTFCHKYIRHRIANYLRKDSRDDYKRNSRLEYMDANVNNESEDSFKSCYYGYQEDFTKIEGAEIYEMLKSKYSKKQMHMLDLRIIGYNMKEIAKVIGCTEGNVSQVICRMKKDIELEFGISQKKTYITNGKVKMITSSGFEEIYDNLKIAEQETRVNICTIRKMAQGSQSHKSAFSKTYNERVRFEWVK